MFGAPFLRAAGAACCRHIPGSQMFDLDLALDDEDRTPGGDRLDYFRQPVGQRRHSIHIPQAPTRFVRIRSLLTKCLFTLAAFL